MVRLRIYLYISLDLPHVPLLPPPAAQQFIDPGILDGPAVHKNTWPNSVMVVVAADGRGGDWSREVQINIDFFKKFLDRK